MSQSRNAACACGSGLKYKRCCGAPGAEPKVAVDSADDGMVESTTKKKPTWAQKEPGPNLGPGLGPGDMKSCRV